MPWVRAVDQRELARGRDRHRRLPLLLSGSTGPWCSSRRAASAGRGRAARSPTSISTPVSARAPSTSTASAANAAAGLTIATECLEAFAAAFGCHADAVLADVDLRPLTVVDAIVSASEPHARSGAGSHGLLRFGLGNPEPMLLVASVEATSPSTVGEGKHLPLPRPPAGPRRRLGDRVRARVAARPAAGVRTGRRRLSAEREPLERHGGSTARGAPRVRDAGGLRGARTSLAEQWRSGEATWTPEAHRIFGEPRLMQARDGSCSNRRAQRAPRAGRFRASLRPPDSGHGRTPDAEVRHRTAWAASPSPSVASRRRA